MNKPATHDDSNVIKAYEPDFALKKLIGKDVVLAEVFTPEKIQACQKLVDDASASFFTNAQGDLIKVEQAIHAFAKSKKGKDVFFEDVGHAISNLKGQAEMFGFSLITKICVQIIEWCKSTQDPVDIRFSLIKELFSALQLAIHHSITDDGGEIGKTLLSDMDKYRSRKKAVKA
jgi:hypothetical protein